MTEFRRFLFIIIVLFVLLRLPSLFEPYWYGDEGIYQTVGMALREGRMLYAQIWDNKPPLLFLLYASVWGDQFSVRILSLLTGAVSISLFSFLAKSVLTRLRSVCLAIAVYAILFGLPLLEGNIANAENFMLPLTLSGMALLLRKASAHDKRMSILCGVFLSIAFLIKTVALFDLLAVAVFLLFQKDFRRVVSVCIGFVPLPLIAWAYFSAAGIAPIFFRSVFIEGIGYVRYNNELFIPHGLLIAKTALLVLILLWLFYRRSRFSRGTLFTLIWFSCSVYTAYFSGRGYVHYLLLLLPAYALLAGRVLEEKKRYSFSLMVLVCSTMLIIGTFNVYGNTLWYYANVMTYAAGLKSETQYRAFFDPITVRNYRIAAFINRNLSKEDRIFLWGNSAQIYKMTGKLPPGRYAVAYHMVGNEERKRETEEAFRSAKPEFLVILPGHEQYPYGLEGYALKTIIDGGEIYQRTDMF